MAGLVPLVLFGNRDFSSENLDFSILSPTWLAVGLIVGGTALFGAALGSVAARLQQTAQGDSRFRNVPILGVVPFALVPPFFVGLVVCVIGRTALPGRLSAVLEQRPIQLAGRVVVAGLVGVSLLLTVRSSVDILTSEHCPPDDQVPARTPSAEKRHGRSLPFHGRGCIEGDHRVVALTAPRRRAAWCPTAPPVSPQPSSTRRSS